MATEGVEQFVDYMEQPAVVIPKQIKKKRSPKSRQSKNKRNPVISTSSTHDDSSALSPTKGQGRVLLTRGISDTYDGASLAKDTTCKRLLRSCKTDADRLDAVIIAGLLHHNASELFAGAAECATSEAFPENMINFAHGLGDLHTSLNAVRSWLNEERQTPKSNLTRWCRENNMLTSGMKSVLHYIKDFRKLWDYEDEAVSTETLSNHSIVATLCEVFSEELCEYLGHPEVGYKNLRTGEMVSVCPASTIRLLRHMPKYVLRQPRHMHQGISVHFCDHLLNVDMELAKSVIKSLYPNHNMEEDTMYVTEVSGVTIESSVCRQKFMAKWNHSDQCSKERLAALVDKTPVVITQDNITLKAPRIWANEWYHGIVCRFLHSAVASIREELINAKVELTYPKKSAMRLVMGKGLTCQPVLFPLEATPADSTIGKRDAIRNQDTTADLININFNIHLSVQIGCLKHLDIWRNTNYDPLLKSSAVIRRLLADLNRDSWDITSSVLSKDGSVQMELLFTTRISGRRAIQILEEGAGMGIPLKLLNKSCAEKELNCFEVVLDKQVMHALKGTLLAKLENFRCSERFGVEYKTIVDGTDKVRIQVVTKEPRMIPVMLEKIDDCLKSEKHISGLFDFHWSFLRSPEGRYFLQDLNKCTDAYIYYNRREEVVHCYGTAKAKKDVKTIITEFINRGPASPHNYLWRHAGNIKLNTGELPNDFFIRFRQQTENLSGKCGFKSVRCANVDLVRGEIWTESLPLVDDMDTLKKLIVECLLHDYGITTTLTVDTPELEKPTCAACYSPVSSDYHILEVCGHAYCEECLKTQVETCIKESQLPLSCAECDTAVSVSDLEQLLYESRICKLKGILSLSMRHFLREHPTEYKPCTAINCVGITRKHSLLDFFACGVCYSKTCPSCFQRYHVGMTCEEYEVSFLSIENWMRENCKQRKSCTNCKMGIEKYDGCNNVLCAYCKKNLCWVCLKVFDNSDSCYAHMDSTGHWDDNA